MNIYAHVREVMKISVSELSQWGFHSVKTLEVGIHSNGLLRKTLFVRDD